MSSQYGVEIGPAATDGDVLRLTGLRREFGEVVAVDGVDLAVRPGEFFGFLGPNGAGKTTTIRMAAGLLRPSAGTVRVLGLDPASSPLEVKAAIGVVPEEAPLYDRLTGFESVELVARLHGLGAAAARREAEATLHWLGLDDAASRQVGDYSQGMRKKVALGCALVHRPRLLFLDEPFSGIDPVAVRAIKEVLAELVADGVSIFFSSHVMELAERLCSRVAIIHRGRIRACGTLSELRAELGLTGAASLEDVFMAAIGGDGEAS